MATIDDNNALLLYRVGPVLCSSPCLAISAIIEPPTLTRPPGASSARPGIFKHANAIVSSVDLRYKFGVDEADWVTPGRTIVTQLDIAHVGFYVDEILDVISLPTSGWGQLPALLPRGIFSRTLLFKQRIYLYAEFTDLQRIADSGYLRTYIQHLLETDQRKQPAQAATSASNVSNSTTVNPAAKATAQQHAALNEAVTQPPRVASVSASAFVMQSAQTSRGITAEHKPAGMSPVTAQNATSPQSTRQSGAATASDAVTRNKAAKVIHTTQTNKPASLKTTSNPTRAANSVTAQRAPVAQVQPTNTVTPMRSDKPPAVHTTTTSLPAYKESPGSRETASPIAVLLLLMLLFAVGGVGLWYALRDDSRHASNAALAPITPDVTQAPATIASVTPPAQTAPETTYRDIPSTASTATPTAHAEDSHAQTTAALVAIPTSNSTTPPPQQQAAKPSTNVDAYHASIEQDPHGLTIILDAPADDPVFTQPQATRNNDTMIATTPAAAEARVEKPASANTEVANSETNPRPEAAITRSTSPQSVEIIHIVVKGDTLWDIARRYVNNPFRYPELARLSKIKNPDLIYPGNRVRIIKRKHQP